MDTNTRIRLDFGIVPEDVKVEIFKYLELHEILFSIQLTCKKYWAITKKYETLWKEMYRNSNHIADYRDLMKQKKVDGYEHITNTHLWWLPESMRNEFSQPDLDDLIYNLDASDATENVGRHSKEFFGEEEQLKLLNEIPIPELDKLEIKKDGKYRPFLENPFFQRKTYDENYKFNYFEEVKREYLEFVKWKKLSTKESIEAKTHQLQDFKTSEFYDNREVCEKIETEQEEYVGQHGEEMIKQDIIHKLLRRGGIKYSDPENVHQTYELMKNYVRSVMSKLDDIHEEIIEEEDVREEYLASPTIHPHFQQTKLEDLRVQLIVRPEEIDEALKRKDIERPTLISEESIKKREDLREEEDSFMKESFGEEAEEYFSEDERNDLDKLDYTDDETFCEEQMIDLIDRIRKMMMMKNNAQTLSTGELFDFLGSVKVYHESTKKVGGLLRLSEKGKLDPLFIKILRISFDVHSEIYGHDSQFKTFEFINDHLGIKKNIFILKKKVNELLEYEFNKNTEETGLSTNWKRSHMKSGDNMLMGSYDGRVDMYSNRSQKDVTKRQRLVRFVEKNEPREFGVLSRKDVDEDYDHQVSLKSINYESCGRYYYTKLIDDDGVMDDEESD